MKKAVLFDLDGTLVNSLCDLCDAVNYMLDKMELKNRSLDEVRQFVGNGIDMLVRRAVGEREFDFDTAMAYYREYYDAHLCSKTAPYQGIEQAVKELKARDFKLAVVTNKAQYAAEAIVSHYFGSSFDAVVGADLSKRRKKPYTDPVELALKTLNVSVNDAVFVGDSEVDIKTAENAGMDFVGAAWGFRNEDIFADKRYIARNWQQLLNLCCNFS